MFKLEIIVNEPQLVEMAENVQQAYNELYELREEVTKLRNCYKRSILELDGLTKEVEETRAVEEAVLLELTNLLNLDEIEREEHVHVIMEYYREQLGF